MVTKMSLTYSAPTSGKPSWPTPPPNSCSAKPQAIDAVRDAFGLTARERRILLTAPPGTAYWSPAGTGRHFAPSLYRPSTCSSVLRIIGLFSFARMGLWLELRD
jgi:hypothetical protein